MTEKRYLGRYEIESEIGSGAMACVFKALDPVIERIVAIKQIRLDLLDDPEERDEYKERLFLEARIGGKLMHPNIVVLHDAGIHDEKPFIAMEYVEGTTLGSLIRDRGPLPKDMGAEIIGQIATALDFAHSHQIIHRDIKPQNIMVTPEGVAKVMDFGIARLTDTQMTETGLFLGTPRYCSPEQIRDTKIDHHTDIFSLAVLAHETFSSETPFTGDTVTDMLYHLVHTTPQLSKKLLDLGMNRAAMKSVFFRALAKDPQARFHQATDFAFALMTAMGLEPVVRGSTQKLSTLDPQQTPGGQPGQGLPEAPCDDGTTVSMSSLEAEPRPEAMPSPGSVEVRQAKNRKTLVGVLFILAVIVVLAAIGVPWLFLQRHQKQPEVVNLTKQPEVLDLTETAVEATRPIRVYSEPPGAEIFLDGAHLGKTPLVHPWPESDEETHLLEAHLTGYVSQVTHLQGSQIHRPMKFELREAQTEKEEPVAPVEDSLQTTELELRPGVPPDEQNVWIETKKRNNLLSFRRYLESYPQGAYADVAQQRVEEIQTWLFFDQAKKSGDVAELQSFLDSYPDSRFGLEVRREIHRLRLTEGFEQAMAEPTYTKLSKFLLEFEATASKEQVSQVKALLDQMKAEEKELYAAIAGTEVSSEFKTYLDNYAEIHPERTAQIRTQLNAWYEKRNQFLRKNLVCLSPKKQKRVKRSGVEVKYRFKAKPDFALSDVHVKWRLGSDPWKRLELTKAGRNFENRLPKETFREANFQVQFFATDTIGLEYQLDVVTSRISM